MNLQRLDADETRKLLEVADDVVGDNGRALAVAAYGSKVAGYGRPDSDYDIIVVAKKFKGRIRYQYVTSPVTASALVVEESLLESDAVKAYLGEFVSGRLLNVYEPILNGDIFRKAELESKKRVLAEEILELGSQHGEFAQDLLIPLEYFLFDKLHKRALIYPPALYSYVKTYTCPSGDENKAFTLEGFAQAALSLQSSGVLKVEADGMGRPHVRILGEGLRSTAFASLLSLFNLTRRGVRQYAVHGYAGRVGFSVFKDEALSKVKRMQEKVGPAAGAGGAEAPHRPRGGVHASRRRSRWWRGSRRSPGSSPTRRRRRASGRSTTTAKPRHAQGRDGERGEVRLQALRGHPLGEVGGPQRLVALAQVQHVSPGEDAQGIPRFRSR